MQWWLCDSVTRLTALVVVRTAVAVTFERVHIERLWLVS
jgi:hypothetical protein